MSKDITWELFETEPLVETPVFSLRRDSKIKRGLSRRWGYYITVVRVPLSEAEELLRTGRITHALVIAALLWFLLTDRWGDSRGTS